MKKDVGIITIHYVDNLGGALLAFALQDSVDRMGYNCHVIDYDPTPIPSRVRYLANSIIRRVLRIPIYLRDFQYYFGLLVKSHGSVLPPMHIHRSVGIRKTRFDEFRRKYIKLSEQHYNSSESLLKSPPQYDAYICGSDQIWNPFICKEPEQAKNDPAYFLCFTIESKRISYAPSIALPSIPEKFREEMTEMLQGIPYLSSREKHGVEIIKELTGRDAEVVVDPTLLLNSGQWNQIAAEPAIKGPYILCYFLGDGLEYRNFAEQLHKKTGLRLIVISQRLHDLESLDTINCSDAGPAEFLGLVKNASCVCTDSYHGTIFSINFQRPFYVFERPGSFGSQSTASRIYSILDLLGLTSRLVKPTMSFPEAPLHIDYSKAEILLQEERAHSLQYLENALKHVTRDEPKDLSDKKDYSRT